MEALGMKIKSIVVGLILICMIMFSCDDQGDNVFGSRDHDIKSLQSSMPEILANGVDFTDIVAIVLTKDGNIAFNMKVVFQTSTGTIDRYDMTNENGEAHTTLTSTA